MRNDADRTSNEERNTPGWRDEILTRSAAVRTTNSSDGASSTASPSIPDSTALVRVDDHRRAGPRSRRWASTVARPVEDEDTEPTVRESRAATGHKRPAQRVGVVGDQHQRRLMLAAEIVHTVTVRSGAARTEDRLRRLEECLDLRVAVARSGTVDHVE